jgi:bifunctional N-acetylglucosamine-1-phosphate-uridyltransferase/glucosamine-1-phosphate-acetyltransferase GlmU-like protein
MIRGENGDVVRIVEHKDATPAEAAVREVNTGTYVFDRAALDHALKLIKSDNAQKEFYLTDAISILRGEGRRVSASVLDDPREMTGINTPEQLHEAEELFAAMRPPRSVLKA